MDSRAQLSLVLKFLRESGDTCVPMDAYLKML
jgi:hypothetical protein